MHVVDHTVTQGGKRLLRANLMMPICNRVTLEARVAATETLRAKDAVRQSIRKHLKSVQGDVDHLLSKFATPSPSARDANYAETTIKHVLGLRGVITAVPTITASLEGVVGGASLLKSVEQALGCTDLDGIKEKIDTVVDGSVQQEKKVSAAIAKTIHVFSVRSGIDGMLDVVRAQYSSILEKIYSTAGQISKEHNVTTLKVIYTNARGFILQCEKAEVNKGADTFIMRTFSKRRVQFTTQDLVSLNNKLSDAYGEIINRTNMQISTLVEGIRKKMSAFFRVSEAIALLDILQSAATHSLVHEGYAKPVFTDAKICIKQGRHPLWDGKGVSCIPNDTVVDGGKLVLLSGPNMSGKTTYLTQVATIVVMAHVGLFVPAGVAEVPLVDSIFTRLGLDDSIEANASTFMMEMRETAHVLRNATAKSLVVVDELGRGTSNFEGAAVACAVAEKLASIGCFTLFATHVVQLHCLPKVHQNIVNMHFTVRQEGDALRCLYKLEEGDCSLNRYGISLAREMNFPDEVVRLAEEMAGKLGVEEIGKDEWKLLHTYADKVLGVVSAEGMMDGDKRVCLQRVKAELSKAMPIDELLQRVHVDATEPPAAPLDTPDVHNDCPTQLIDDWPLPNPKKRAFDDTTTTTNPLDLSSTALLDTPTSLLPQWGVGSRPSSSSKNSSSNFIDWGAL